MTDLNSDIEEVIKNLKLSEKKSLNNIYLQLIDEKDENTFINLDTGEKINYKIVGKDEADLKQKLIYFQSPIGKGLIGKNKNDLVEIKTPSGEKNFEIEDVKYL